MANTYSNLLQRRDRDGERHIIEHIRRNGYIDHDTLGGFCLTEGIGDRVPTSEDDREKKRRYEFRKRRLAEWERQQAEQVFPNVTQKHNPDF